MKKLFFISLGIMAFIGCQNDDDASFTHSLINKKSEEWVLTPELKKETEAAVQHMFYNNVEVYAGFKTLCKWGGPLGDVYSIVRYTGSDGYTMDMLVHQSVSLLAVVDHMEEISTLVSVSPIFDAFTGCP